MIIDYTVVDAFVDPQKLDSGNPAAVIVLDSENQISDEQRQFLANKINLSETVFLINNDSTWSIRWFTPMKEVNLCGHATMAAAFILFNQQNESNYLLKFQSNFHQANLEARLESQDRTIVLNFPSNSPASLPKFGWIDEVIESLIDFDRDQIIDVQLSSTTKKLLIRLKDCKDSFQSLRKIQLDSNKMITVDTNDAVRGLIITQKSSSFQPDDCHFCSRYFAPWVGIVEDPVTGSAHTVLTPYWDQIYRNELGLVIEEFKARQLSNREGLLWCRLVGNDRLTIKGHCKSSRIDHIEI
ncbi:phenazine biosynthesis-like protein domain-containing protein-like protein [Sarcoptes scabiei]|uniref:Phenazine biosynthesis-like protein domain-containing protein-like protein n=1 Tax=Sarcoptes scabiei TaxID=52283 RepID=A0A132AI60_SARSC|nr:phenazine biosynthesis-like protein domain-containing protein-like protein [Sarcoptes scabiei]